MRSRTPRKSASGGHGAVTRQVGLTTPILLVAALLAGSIGIAPEALAAGSYDAAAEFSATANPSGTWSYGWSTTRAAGFAFATQRTNVGGEDIWFEPIGDPVVPGVFHNGTDHVVDPWGAAPMQPGQLALHPGRFGDNAVLRWTAPATGTWAIDATFTGLDLATGTTTDVAILGFSGAELFSDFINGYGTTRTFTGTVVVLAGETIDFKVGFGSNGTYYSDLTGLDVTIQQVTLTTLGNSDLAEDLLSNAASTSPRNPYADSNGVTSWYMMGSPTAGRVPSTYWMLTSYSPTACGQPGLPNWLGPGGMMTFVNTTAATINGTPCATSQVLPSHKAFAHPGSGGLAIFAWRSPLAGLVTIEGGFTDADCAGGNGIAWYVDQGATDLASGAIGNCGAQAIPSGLTATVAVGDFLYFIVDPGGPTLNQFDMTELDVTILGDSTPPTITGSAAPPANANGWNNTPVTVSFECSDSGSGVASCPSPTVLSGEGADQSVTGTAFDNAGNSASATVGPIDIDLTGPSITGVASPPPNGAGWNNTDVSVHWVCFDGLSGIDGACPADSLITGEGTGLSASASISDRAGNSATGSVSVDIDRTAPLTTASAPSGWNNVDVTVVLDAFDNLSGIDATHFVLDGGATQTGSSLTIGDEGDHTLEYWSVDVAGNEEGHHEVHVLIDETSPSITHTQEPPPNGNGWNNTSVTVTFVCTDDRSGIASCTDPVTVASEGLSQTVTGTAVDNAGNSATDVAAISIDQTAPSISGAGTSSPNEAGWYRAPVTVAFTCSDALSGVASCPAPVTLSADGAGQSVSGSAIDAADNSASTTVSGIDLDQVAPTVTITSPANGASYTVGQAVVAAYSCSDALSGIDSCVGTVADGAAIDTATSGSKSFVVTATDRAGNVTSSTVSYSVTVPASLATATTVTSSANPSVLNGSVAFTATVSATSGTPSGTVQWQIDGANSGSPVALDANARATMTTSALSLTNTTPHVISAIYSGAPGFDPSTGTLSQFVTYASTGTCAGSPGHQILQPVNVDGTSVFKAKSTVPAKFRVCDANGVSIGTPGVVTSFRLTQIINGTVIDYVDEAVNSTTPDTEFRWGANQWIFNISTKGMAIAKTYVYTITLNDGSTIVFQFGLR